MLFYILSPPFLLYLLPRTVLSLNIQECAHVDDVGRRWCWKWMMLEVDDVGRRWRWKVITSDGGGMWTPSPSWLTLSDWRVGNTWRYPGRLGPGCATSLTQNASPDSRYWEGWLSYTEKSWDCTPNVLHLSLYFRMFWPMAIQNYATIVHLLSKNCNVQKKFNTVLKWLNRHFYIGGRKYVAQESWVETA